MENVNKKLLIPRYIVTVNDNNDILLNHAIEINESIITKIAPLDSFDVRHYDGEVIYAQNMTLIPGFIQTHIHLCQTLFRGLADDLELLDWLQNRIFPLENAHDEHSLRASVQIGLHELQTGGTTTLLDMGTLRHQEVIFEELDKSGMRAFAGKCMIDDNDLCPDFKNNTKDELAYTYELAMAYHNRDNGRIQYGFAPRFVLSCTEKLLRETKAMAADFPGSVYHTHSSENKSEIKEVRRRTGKENISYFESINILDSRTILAHCIHLNDVEIDLLKKREVRVVHCPSSNLKLASGIAPIYRFLNEHIQVSIGADGAPCNNSLSAFTEMRMAALLQKPFHGPRVCDAQRIFRLATIDGAKALHINSITGSIEEGKKADLVLLDLNNPDYPILDNEQKIYSSIVYSAQKDCVRDVMINGNWVVKYRKSTKFDRAELLKTGMEQLKLITKRVNL
jgi:cytosine/adenosine deaminase-related metal-dependent hydrolase